MRGNMVKAEEDIEDLKLRLVKEICLVSSISCSCRRPRSFPGKSEFVDWYRLLRIQENAGIDVIRKRYHQLALQIHPDKNKHPNAGVAFKLVSEAYECLSNSSKRVEFDLERANRICTRCQRSRPSEAFGTLDRANKVNGTEFSSRRARQEKAKRQMKQAIKEEAKVMASSISICHQTPRNESPIFDPAMYSSGYPHRRTPLECSGFLDSRRQQNEIHASSRRNGRRNHQKKGEELPLFENCNRIPYIFPNRTKRTVLEV